MTVYESDLPGVGRKFEFDIDDDQRLIVVVHHDGRREVFARPAPDADSRKLFDLDDRQARQFGSILEGAYFQPVEVESLAVPLGEAIIEWIQLEDESPLVGLTLGQANVRRRTGASIIAVQRGAETIANPDAQLALAVDDYLVSLGSRREQAALRTLVESGEPDTGAVDAGE